MNDSSHAPIPPSGEAGLNQQLLSSLEALSRASSCLIAVVGLAVLLGWHFDIELLRAGLPGRTPVNPATALALLLAASALWMHHQARGRPDSAPVRWLAVTAASLVIAPAPARNAGNAGRGGPRRDENGHVGNPTTTAQRHYILCLEAVRRPRSC